MEGQREVIEPISLARYPREAYKALKVSDIFELETVNCIKKFEIQIYGRLKKFFLNWGGGGCTALSISLPKRPEDR